MQPLDPQLIVAEIEKYDPNQARQVTERARKEACLTSAASEWLELYREVVAENRGLNELPSEDRRREESAALAEYLVKWGYDARIEVEKERIKSLLRWPLLGRCFGWVLERERMRILNIRGVPRHL